MSSDRPVSGPTLGHTVQLGGGARLLSVEGFTLRVLTGSDAGKSAKREDERTVIGTHESADLVLSDKAVSRFHCEIRSRAGQLVVRDLDSRNGVFVDGVRVLEAFVAPGATLTVGQTTLKLELTKDSVELDLFPSERFGVMVGQSLPMRRAFSLLARAAKSNATVLLGGETGTGKEAAAESVHRESLRREGPFVVVDCGAVPANLLESELFGHEKGAFTGAIGPRKGAFEAASGGTIFLDEIGELDSELQPKLLRVLEKREIKRIGSNQYQPVDVRVIAATHRNLKADVNAKRFRPDLYYRLAVVEVTLPALRERVEDLPLLVRTILAGSGLADHPDAQLVRTPHFFSTLAAHDWPGNVRELRNYVERCLALSEQTPLCNTEQGAAGTELSVDISRPLKAERERVALQVERAYLEAVLAAHDGNVTAAARASGVDRIHFHRLLRKHQLKSQP